MGDVAGVIIKYYFANNLPIMNKVGNFYVRDILKISMLYRQIEFQERMDINNGSKRIKTTGN
jgi:hypothetical protein